MENFEALRRDWNSFKTGGGGGGGGDSFVITVTAIEDDDTVITDKTFEECKAACQAHKTIVLVDNSDPTLPEKVYTMFFYYLYEDEDEDEEEFEAFSFNFGWKTGQLIATICCFIFSNNGTAELTFRNLTVDR